jgi:hypothetical protein
MSGSLSSACSGTATTAFRRYTHCPGVTSGCPGVTSGLANAAAAARPASSSTVIRCESALDEPWSPVITHLCALTTAVLHPRGGGKDHTDPAVIAPPHRCWLAFTPANLVLRTAPDDAVASGFPGGRHPVRACLRVRSGAGGCYPARAGGPWLWSTLVLSLFHAVVVPSGLTTRVQPRRWIITWWW